MYKHESALYFEYSVGVGNVRYVQHWRNPYQTRRSIMIGVISDSPMPITVFLFTRPNRHAIVRRFKKIFPLAIDNRKLRIGLVSLRSLQKILFYKQQQRSCKLIQRSATSTKSTNQADSPWIYTSFQFSLNRMVRRLSFHSNDSLWYLTPKAVGST